MVCRPTRSGRRETIARGRRRAAQDGATLGGRSLHGRVSRVVAAPALGWPLEVPHHPDRQLWRYGLEEKPRGFEVLPGRWVVERTFAWLGLSRRFSKDYARVS